LTLGLDDVNLIGIVNAIGAQFTCLYFGWNGKSVHRSIVWFALIILILPPQR